MYPIHFEHVHGARCTIEEEEEKQKHTQYVTNHEPQESLTNIPPTT